MALSVWAILVRATRPGVAMTATMPDVTRDLRQIPSGDHRQVGADNGANNGEVADFSEWTKHSCLS